MSAVEPKKIQLDFRINKFRFVYKNKYIYYVHFRLKKIQICFKVNKFRFILVNQVYKNENISLIASDN